VPHPVPAVTIDSDRLVRRLSELAAIGGVDGTHGCSRLALTDEDREGRDLVVAWMRDLGLDVTIDRIGNVVATTHHAPGRSPVMTGSHIDTVREGGRYDGNLGVLAGLEVIESVLAADTALERSLAVAFFTDEEGARFAPDMLGSLVYVGGLQLESALEIRAADGAVLGDELDRIGYSGSAPVPGVVPHAFVELHIEQGPVLDDAGIDIGVVEGVQGISWTEVTLTGQARHAGTTPMHLRRDAGRAAAEIAVGVRGIADELGGAQVATVGALDLTPNLVNVVPSSARLTVDLRNTDEALLQKAEQMLADLVARIAADEKVEVETRSLARFEPVVFHPQVVDLVGEVAAGRGLSVRAMPSGAGHDAQMMARVCPSGMVFVPSVDGVSHNVAEFTGVDDLANGTQVLADTLLRLTATDFEETA
jgi:N-carbamoyl-L-amino-acid hydrolase